jgi:hypothetical protein
LSVAAKRGLRFLLWAVWEECRHDLSLLKAP